MRLLTTLLVVLLVLSGAQERSPTPKTQKAQQETRSATPKDQSLPVVAVGSSDNKAPTGHSEHSNPYDPREDCLYRWYMRATILGVVGGFVGIALLIWQTSLLSKTVRSSGEQSAAMERHIGEASRSATAMENVATIIRSGNTAIMRAYLSVIIGGGIYQDRNEGLKFEGKPSLVNTGSTPARNVRVRIAAQLVPRGDAETFAYPIPEEIAKASTVVAPHQTYVLSAIVNDFVADVEVASIKQGQSSALTVWGVITYDDIFGESHTTKFAQWLFWYPNNTLYGYYVPGQNDMS